MGSRNYSSAWKNCATCAHWQAPREVSEDRANVVVNGSVAGICEGFWKGARKYGNDKCSEWTKWAELGGWSVREIGP
jgi:hypothetical protein